MAHACSAPETADMRRAHKIVEFWDAMMVG